MWLDVEHAVHAHDYGITSTYPVQARGVETGSTDHQASAVRCCCGFPRKADVQSFLGLGVDVGLDRCFGYRDRLIYNCINVFMQIMVFARNLSLATSRFHGMS